MGQGEGAQSAELSGGCDAPATSRENYINRWSRRRIFSSAISHGLKDVPFSDYAVYNLQKENEHRYTALAVIAGQEGYETRPVLIIPLTLQKEKGWTVTQSGKISKYKASFIDIYWGLEKLPGTVASEGKGKTGIIRINEQTIRIVDNQIQDQEDFFADMMGNGFSFDVRAKRSAKIFRGEDVHLGRVSGLQKPSRAK